MANKEIESFDMSYSARDAELDFERERKRVKGLLHSIAGAHGFGLERMAEEINEVVAKKGSIAKDKDMRAAVKMITDFVYGTPSQKVEHTGGIAMTSPVSADELEAVKKELGDKPDSK